MGLPIRIKTDPAQTATITGPWRDLGDDGPIAAVAVLDADAATGGVSPTLDVKVQTSDVADESDVTDLYSFPQVTTAVKSKKKRVSPLQRFVRFVATISPAGAFAALSTNLANAVNNDLDYTAKAKGTAGNGITVAYVDPGGVTAVLSVAVVGQAITVNLGRAASAINSTAAAVRTAVLASAAAAALVDVANKAANDGTGLVAALAPTNLTGGLVPGTFAFGVDLDIRK